MKHCDQLGIVLAAIKLYISKVLVANIGKESIEADVAQKGPEYICPKCQSVVILKKGRIRIDHFAHKPPVECAWGKGETIAHREAKLLCRDEFRRRGLETKVEYEIPTLFGDRRADVMIWLPKSNQAYALELVHSAMDYDALKDRTKSYINAGVRVIWIPFLPKGFDEEGEWLWSTEEGDLVIERFVACQWYKWINGYNYGKFWMYDPSEKNFWKGKLQKCDLYKEYSEWYSPEGELETAGGYPYPSRLWRKLLLWGPYDIEQLELIPLKRDETIQMGGHIYPGGTTGTFKLIS